MKQTRGFTLIELLVVVFIVSIVSSVAVLTIGHSNTKQVEKYASELTQVLAYAEQRAILKSDVYGVSLHKDNLQFSNLKLTKGTLQTWVPMVGKVLGKRRIPSDIVIRFQASDVDEPKDDKINQPQIIISANGDVSAFTLLVGQRGKKPMYMISGDGNGNVSRKELT